MCGRYASSRSPEDLVEEFEIDRVEVKETLAPDFNVAPTKPVYAVVERPPRASSDGDAGDPAAGRDAGEGDAAPAERQLRTLRWGLVPFWAKDPSIGNKMINARMETVHEKPAFRQRVRHAALPAAGRRLLRVVPHRAEDQGRQAASSSRSSSIPPTAA